MPLEIMERMIIANLIHLGVIECFDIRDKKWFQIDELTKIFNYNQNQTNKRWFQCVLNSI